MQGNIVPAPLSVHNRTVALTVALGTYLFIVLAGMMSELLQINLLARVIDGATISEAEVLANDGRQALIALGTVAVFIICGVLFAMWIHRAYRVLVERGLPNLEYSPARAAGYFFYPIKNLYMPHRVVTEIWNRSREGAGLPPLPGGEADSGKVLLGGWWMAWIISGAMSWIVGSLVGQAETASGALGVTKLMLVADAVTVLATILAIMVIRGIDRRQQVPFSPPVAAPCPTRSPVAVR